MRFVRAALTAACLMTFSAIAGAQVVQTFEDFTPCDAFPPNVGMYGNVNYLFQWTCISNALPPFTPHSGTNSIFASNGSDNSASASFAFAPTTFSGAWFSGSANVMFLLFLGANQVAVSSSLVTTATPTFLSSSYSGLVDRVTVVGNTPAYVMDDVTFNAATTVTPEPASIALVAGGLAVMGAGLRLRRRKNSAAQLG